MMMLEKIKNVLDETVERREAAGISCLISQNGKNIGYFQSGLSDIAADRPIQRNTIFRLYSMTKPVTAAAVMLLVQNGKIDLQEPVSDWLPFFRNLKVSGGDGLRDAAGEVRIQDLLNMTSGYSYGGRACTGMLQTEVLLDTLAELADTDKMLSTMEVARRLAEIPLAFDPGTRFLYGMSADILGAVVEAVSGMRFGAFLQQAFFDPLEMSDTGFYVPQEKQDRLSRVYERETTASGSVVLKEYKMAHLGISNEMKKPPVFESGGAGLVSTIDDFQKFCQMLLQDGRYHSKQILMPRTVHFMSTVHIRTELEKGLSDFESLSGYSYGNLMRILTCPEYASTLGRKGEYGWDGWLGCYMSVIPDIDASILVMQQMAGAGTTKCIRKIRNIVFANLE